MPSYREKLIQNANISVIRIYCYVMAKLVLMEFYIKHNMDLACINGMVKHHYHVFYMPQRFFCRQIFIR